jgi:hypothetical protein
MQGSKPTSPATRSAPPAHYLNRGGSLENAPLIAPHESPRTKRLYDRTTDDITLDDIERIGI